jgi:hypothetical protein
MSKFTTSWDETKPAGTRSKLLGDDDIREFKQQFRERFGEDHYTLQNESDDALVGFHKKATLLEQASDPASLADAFIIYSKLADSYSDLYGRHENAGVQRLTRLGKLWIEALGVASEARGDMLLRGASVWGRLAIGASGTYLKSDGTDAAWAALSVLFSELPNGVPLKFQSKLFSAVDSGATATPDDDSIPTSSEGNLFITADAYTPLVTTSKLKIEVVAHLASGTTDTSIITASLFKDSDANAIAASQDQVSASNTIAAMKFTWVVDASTLDARTYKVRFGHSGGGTLTFNGTGAARKMGGIMASSICITEPSVAL